VKRDADVVKALKATLETLQPGQFAEFNPKLQLMLTVRMIYENPEHMQLLSGLDIAQQSSLLEAAEAYILKNDPALESARQKENLPKLQELLGRLMDDDSTDVQKKWMRTMKLPGIFGEEGAETLYNFCHAAKVLSEQQDRAMRSDAPDKPELPSLASAAGTAAKYVIAMHTVPKDFCTRAKAMLNDPQHRQK